MIEEPELAQRSSGLEQKQNLGTRPEMQSKGCRTHQEPNCVKAVFILTMTAQNHAAYTKPTVSLNGASQCD